MQAESDARDGVAFGIILLDDDAVVEIQDGNIAQKRAKLAVVFIDQGDDGCVEFVLDREHQVLLLPSRQH